MDRFELYSPLKNTVTSKSGLEVIQGN